MTAPASGTTIAYKGSATLTASASDSVGQISSVTFLDGTTVLTTTTSAPYTYTYSNIASGSHSLTAKAVDLFGAFATSSSVAITVNPVPVVSVSLTSPPSGTQIAYNGSATLVASASDSANTLSSVSFYDGATLLATLTSPPFTYTYSSMASGSHTLTATAIDSYGISSTSAGVSVGVNFAPAVSLTSPANGASANYPGVVDLTATASETGGSISQVAFYAGSTLITTVSQPPYSWVWDNVPTGTYSITAVATDARGVSMTSTAATLNVGFGGASVTGTSTAAAGTIHGTLSVDQIGAANYGIPIRVAPGTASMAPSLSLAYNSGGGNGYLGVGWAISGLPRITRCPQTIAQDAGVHGGVNLDANDRFCLNGSRLIATSGAYGADGTTYATELESFVKVVSHGTAGAGPSYFDVWDRNGVLSEFGNTTDSKILALGQSTASTWALDKVTDPKGNFTNYSYINDTVNGQYYPATISYTGNATTGLVPYNSIQFVYGSRPDIEFYYQGGSVVKNTALITDIKTYAGSNLIFDYRFAYQNSTATGRSHISSITQCDGSTPAVCLNPTTFGWQDASPVSLVAAPVENTGIGASPQLIPLDINGDGKTDFVDVASNSSANIMLLPMISNGSGFADGAWLNTTIAYGSSAPQVLAADINGDGKADLLVLTSTNAITPSSGLLVVTPFFSTGTTWVQGASINTGVAYPSMQTSVMATDVNGDGRTDLVVALNNAGNLSLLPLISNGTTFTAGTQFNSAIPFNSMSATSGPSLLVLDVNGDGCGDIVQPYLLNNVLILYPYLSTCTANSFTNGVALNTGQGAPAASTATDSGLIALDINGDGKTDIVQVMDSGVKLSLIPYYSTGTGFVMGASLSTGETYATGANGGPNLIAVDLNGDGRVDLVQQWNNGGTLYLIPYISNGTTFTAQPAINVGTPFLSNWSGTNPSLVASEIDGDGQIDLVQQSVVSGAVGLTILENQAVKPDLMTSVQNGLGAINTLVYQPITDSTVYSPPGTSPVYPSQATQNAYYVVTQSANSNGVGDMHVVTYAYGSAISDLDGRGFLGFGQITSTDGETSGTTTTSYSQTYPLIGRPLTISKTLGGVTLQDVSYTAYDISALGGTRYFVAPQQVDTQAWDINGAFLTWATDNYSYDAYGNVIENVSQSKLSTGALEGFTTSTNNAYSTNTTSWILGLLTQSAVTKTIPSGSSVTRTTGFSYDDQGFMTQKVVEPGNPALLSTTTYTPDAYGNTVQETIASTSNSATAPNILTRSAQISYDAQGRYPVSTTNALGKMDRYVFNPAFGKISSHTDPNNIMVTDTYDTFGRLIAESYPDGTVAKRSYVQCAQCWALSSAYIASSKVVGATGANVTPPQTDFYDSLGREILRVTTGFDGTLTYQEVEYGSRGDIVRTTRPYKAGASLAESTYSYDAFHRILSRNDPDGANAKFSYNGLVSTQILNGGENNVTTLNSQGQIVSVVNAAGSAIASTVSYAYEPFGNPATTTDAVGNIISMNYDARGNRLTISDPDTGQYHFTYDVLGETATMTSPKAQMTTYGYDVLGRLTNRIEADLTSTWTYDSCSTGVGRLCTATTNNGYSRSNSYDALSRPSSVTTTNGNAYTTSFTYDTAGRLSGVTYPSGFSLQRNYNPAGYLASIGLPSSQAYYWQETAADAEGHITGELLGNGVITTRTFNPLNGLVTQIQAGTGAGVQNETFSYDLYHNLNARTDIFAGTTVSESYTNDFLNRLVQSTGTSNGVALPTKSVSYDLTGNILNKSDVGTYSYPVAGSHGAHAVSSVVGTVNGVTNPIFTYDANGNMVSGAGRTVSWTSYNMPAAITSGTNSDTYTYGPEHLRVKELHQDGTSLLFFGQGGAEPHYELQFTSSTVYTYRYYLEVNGAAVGMVLQNQASALSTNYFHLDHQGSVIAVSNDAGKVLQKFSYDAWGRRRNANGTDATVAITSVVDRGYTGHEELDSVALINANGRIYDPALGRFMSTDPNVQAPYHSQSLNRYSYVMNNPMTSKDPTGLVDIVTGENAPISGENTGGGFGDMGNGGGYQPDPSPSQNSPTDTGCSGDGCPSSSNSCIQTGIAGGSCAIVAPRCPEGISCYQSVSSNPPTVASGSTGQNAGARSKNQPQPPTPAGKPGSTRQPCLAPRFANFFGDQVPAAKPVANKYNVPVPFLLSVSAWESGYGTGSPPSNFNAMYSTQFNPFGATPGGDSTPGLTYASFSSAWQSWGNRWGGSVQNVADIQTFISNLQGAGYNTGIPPGGDPNWAPGVASVFPSVQSRLNQYLNGDPTCR